MTVIKPVTPMIRRTCAAASVRASGGICRYEVQMLFKSFCAALLLCAAMPFSVLAASDWNRVSDAFGVPGAVQVDGIYKITMPRSDLHVTVDGVEIRPAFALTSWVAFKPMDNASMIMGDLVLSEKEIRPVMASLIKNGIAVTGLHNHLLRASPAVMYMHIAATGDAAALAGKIREALAATGTPIGKAPAGAPAAVDFDTASLDLILGFSGKPGPGVYGYAIPRPAPVKQDGMEIGAPMGTAIAINFESVGKGTAAITGDFVLAADEVGPVMKALVDHGIEVTALHNHMMGESPRLFFMHFWGVGQPADLAGAVRKALDNAHVKRKI